jgi:hypothetical protein
VATEELSSSRWYLAEESSNGGAFCTCRHVYNFCSSLVLVKPPNQAATNNSWGLFASIEGDDLRILEVAKADTALLLVLSSGLAEMGDDQFNTGTTYSGGEFIISLQGGLN